jgi:hypothetical protein
METPIPFYPAAALKKGIENHKRTEFLRLCLLGLLGCDPCE